VELIKGQSAEEKRKDIINRLRTIKGHIAGIERMIEEGQSCEAVLAQILAARSSIGKVGLLVMENHAHDCLQKPGRNGKIETERVEKMLRTVMDFYNG
jgi:CsoR family transcriptional regulator, copper-sensing transcriptional repressor